MDFTPIMEENNMSSDKPTDGAPEMMKTTAIELISKAIWGMQEAHGAMRHDGWKGHSMEAQAVYAALQGEYSELWIHNSILAERDARIAELEAGYTSDGNLWRFWRDKVFDSVGKNTELHKRLATARNDALEEAANKLKETSNKLRQLGQSQGRVNDFEQASCTILALKSEVG